MIRSVLLALVLLTLAPWPQPGAQTAAVQLDSTQARPGETDPISNPNNLVVFNADGLALFASQNTVASTTLLDLHAESATLTRWSQTGQRLMAQDPCVGSPRRRLLAGRVSTPETEQPICLTATGLSLYPGTPGIADGGFVGYSFELPSFDTSARNFAASAGLLDRSAGTDELLHMEIAAARANFNNDLAVDVVAYAPAENGNEPSLVAAGSWVGEDGTTVTGDTAIALGDYNNDGQLDILVAADTSTGTTGPGRITMRSFAYDPEQDTLTPAGALNVETPAVPRSINLAAGDFGSLGFDQAILSYFPEGGDGKIRVAFYRLTDALLIDSAQVSATLDGVPASASYFETAPGLFHFEPESTQGGNPAVGFQVRQLALACTDAEGTVHSQVAYLSPELTQFQVSMQTAMQGSGTASRTQDVGPSLGVGNLIGVQDDNISPLDQIAVAVPTVVDGESLDAIPELVVADVTYESGKYSIEPVWFDRQPIYQAANPIFSPGMVALDSLGEAYFLGNPAHIQVPDLIDPQYVIGMPPRHVDCLPNDDGTCDVVDVSADTGFSVTLVDSQQDTLRQTSKDSMSSAFGSSAAASVKTTVGGGFMEIAETSVSTSVKTSFSYQDNVTESTVNTQYQQVDTQSTATTSVDDHLIFNIRLIDIWRYPVYGLDLQSPDNFPYYDVVIPGPLSQFSGGGTSTDWYGPSHVNNNALSYPDTDDEDFPPDLGEVTFETAGGEKTVSEPLNAREIRVFDGNAQSFALTYTNSVGGSTEKTYDYSMSNSTDIDVGFSAKANILFVNASTEYDGSISLNATSSWSSSVLAERSMQNSRGITLNQPSVTGVSSQSYGYLT